MRVALIGFGNVGRAFALLVERKRAAFPFRIVGTHTRHETTVHGQATSPLPTVEEFLDRARPEVVVEITTLNPETGEPAISHIRAAFDRGCHVITANKGPIAHAYAALQEEARRAGVEFRFESTVMDGAPLFNSVRNNLPGAKVLGFTGALNSTSKIVIEAMRDGKSMEQGIRIAQRMGVAEADAGYDIDGWDSAAKTAALANVLFGATVTPRHVDRRGIRRLRPQRVRELAKQRKRIVLVSRGRVNSGGVRLRVRPEVLDETNVIASVPGTSNILLLHTDLMGTVGTVSISPGVEQTAYGVFSDLVDIAKSL